MALLQRRRVLALFAAPVALALPVGAAPVPTVRWRGSALGAEASLVIEQVDERRARRLIEQVLGEIDRLENVFSLQRAGSCLSILNARGRLRAPPHELVDVLSEAAQIHRLSQGAFDPSIQPLWRLHAEHFARPDAPPDGPPPGAVAAALRCVGFERVAVEPSEIAFTGRGMALTLNGIAQGAITDWIVDLLRNEALEHVLIDIGEIAAIGSHQSGRPWSIARRHRRSVGHLSLRDAAVATSDPAGTVFDRGRGCHHHLLDPRTGRSSLHARPVTVVAPRAILADGLSTALALLPREEAHTPLAGPDVTVIDAG